MTYLVVNNENLVLSRASPDALLSWELHSGRAIEFATFSGASKCAQMQGGYPIRLSDLAALTAPRPARGLAGWAGSDWSAGVVG